MAEELQELDEVTVTGKRPIPLWVWLAGGAALLGAAFFIYKSRSK